MDFLYSLKALVLLQGSRIKEPCKKGPDGHCEQIPCEPFLDEMRRLASYRRKADDPGCPAHQQSSHLADLHQENINRDQAKMSTKCIRQAAAIMRPVASIDVQRSYDNNLGQAIAVVRYNNNTHQTLRAATISCSAIREASVVAVGQGVVAGPIPDGAHRDLQVRIALAGASFSCVECELTSER